MSTAWQERQEIGNVFWLRIIVTIATRCGRGVARFFMWPTALYFFLRRGPERRSSRLYLERVTGKPVSWWHVYRHIHTFACTILDRLYLFSERFRRFDIRTHGLRELDEALEAGTGVLLIGSHLGSFDALRVLSLERPDVKVKIVIDIEQSQKLSQFLHALNPTLAANIINAREGGPAAAIAIKQALDNNSIVALLADRGQPSNPTQPALFLGHPAPFPLSPWLLGAAVKTPVMLAFGLYSGGNRYDLHFEPFAERVVVDRRRRAEDLAQILQRFADRLAHYARLAPYNWFNFYDFWNNVPDPATAASRQPAARQPHDASAHGRAASDGGDAGSGSRPHDLLRRS
jgi:predicted LPLAT superfamily acyltransferase